MDSIPGPLTEQYFKQKLGGGASFSLQTFDHDSVNKFLDTVQDEQLKGSILQNITHINDSCEKMMNILVKAVQAYHVQTTGEEEKQDVAMELFHRHNQASDYACDFERANEA